MEVNLQRSKITRQYLGRWINAQVPGDVHLDLMNAGIIPEALIEDNTQKWSG